MTILKHESVFLNLEASEPCPECSDVQGMFRSIDLSKHPTRYVIRIEFELGYNS